MNLNALRQFDLNNLLTLKLLIETQHVTRTAEKLNLTQSAVSRILAKLREQLDDPLLVRSGKGLVATKSAEKLLPKVNSILEQVDELIDDSVFDPTKAEGTIRLGTTDYGTQTLLPRLAPLLQQHAPRVTLAAMDWRSHVLTELEQNKVDIMIGGMMKPPEHIYRRVVTHDSYLGVLRKNHPRAQNMLINDYLAMSHIMISSIGEGHSPIDQALSEIGEKRHIAMTVPHFFTALQILSATDYMILLPSHFVRRYVDTNQYEVVSPPFETPEMEVAMFWHERTHRDPLNQWFRNFIFEEIYEPAKRKSKLKLKANTSP